MKKFKKIYIILLGIIIFLTTTSFAATGTVDAPSGLVLRKEASKASEPITTVSDKSVVEIVEKVEDWYKVKYNGQEGYLFAEYVKPQEATETPKTENQTTELEVAPTEGINNVEKYPKNITTISSLKVYIIPVITSTVINNVEIGKSITIDKELNDWAHISFEGKSGWVRSIFIKTVEPIATEETPKIAEQTEQNPSQQEEQKPTETTPIENKKGYINVSTSANVRENASTSATVLTSLITNTEVTIIGEEGDWYKITYKEYTGYISKELVSDKQIEVTSRSNIVSRQQSEENISKETPQEVNATRTSSSSGDAIVAYAKQYLGYDYVSGGTKPSTGFDCTGFTYYIYNNCGYSLSRSCSVQASSGVAVSRENLQPGDLLIFNNGGNGTIGHVGIYIGNGTFIHAANTRRGVVTDTINSGYYNTYYYAARRIV